MPRLKMHATLFAIRHVPTGLYMPHLRGRGYSLLEVEDFKTIPRLFWSLSGAHRAITSWRKGRLSKQSTVRDYFGEYDYDPGGEPLGPPPQSRLDAKLEIVEFQLQEV